MLHFVGFKNSNQGKEGSKCSWSCNMVISDCHFSLSPHHLLMIPRPLFPAEALLMLQPLAHCSNSSKLQGSQQESVMALVFPKGELFTDHCYIRLKFLQDHSNVQGFFVLIRKRYRSVKLQSKLSKNTKAMSELWAEKVVPSSSHSTSDPVASQLVMTSPNSQVYFFLLMKTLKRFWFIPGRM